MVKYRPYWWRRIWSQKLSWRLGEWPMFKVTVSIFVEIYAMHDFRFVISERNICITINIPITLQESLFDVYQVLTMPIATNSNSSVGLSMTSNAAKYLAINTDESHFLELSQNELLHCTNTELKRCSKSFVFSHAETVTTCTFGAIQRS